MDKFEILQSVVHYVQTGNQEALNKTVQRVLDEIEKTSGSTKQLIEAYKMMLQSELPTLKESATNHLEQAIQEKEHILQTLQQQSATYQQQLSYLENLQELYQKTLRELEKYDTLVTDLSKEEMSQIQQQYNYLTTLRQNQSQVQDDIDTLKTEILHLMDTSS